MYPYFQENLSEFNINRDTLVMGDKIVHIEEVRSVAKSNDQFSMKLYNLLKEKEGNLIMSPFSVSGVMAMVSAGAGGNIPVTSVTMEPVQQYPLLHTP